MPLFATILLVFGLGGIAWAVGRAKALRFSAGSSARDVHSLPAYHGWYVAAWALIPALVFAAIWAAAAPRLETRQVLQSPAAKVLPADPFMRATILGEGRAIADGAKGAPLNRESLEIAPAFREANMVYGSIGVVVALLLALAGGALGFTRVRPDFRARIRVERIMMHGLLAASLIAVLTTIGIVASLLFETIRFFEAVGIGDFLFNTRWSPQAATAGDMTAMGAVPLFWGTIFIGAIIAMIVAIPIGLMSAVYLTQYAHPRVRAWMKPTLEILAGVPTVVYGYFAALVIAPRVRDFGITIGVTDAALESALAAGLVMGVMIIPFVSSMADDSIAAVPQSMRDGSLAMGATKSETIRRVLVPAALPGVVGGVLLAVSRAIGETMIVVMAAGFAANMTANPFESVTTVTVQIVKILQGDQDFNSVLTLSAFALGLALFIATFSLNVVALRVVKQFREAYD